MNQSTKPQHTPTPWIKKMSNMKYYIDQDDGTGKGFQIAEVLQRDATQNLDGVTLSIQDSDANAAFIVRAVNSYDELLAAAKAMILWQDTPAHIRGGFPIIQRKLKDAIAKAEDKPS